jgi:hypothetical protein
MSTIDDHQTQPCVGTSEEAAFDSIVDEKSLDTSVALPFSPLVVAVVNELGNEKANYHSETVKTYLYSVLREILHIQTDGRALALFFAKQINEKKSNLPLELFQYFHCLFPETISLKELQVEESLLRKEVNGLEAFFLSDSDSSEWTSEELTSRDELHSAFQITFYIGQLADKVASWKVQPSAERSSFLNLKWKSKMSRLFRLLQTSLEKLGRQR